MRRVLFLAILIPLAAIAESLPADSQLADILLKKLREDPAITFKDFVRFANDQGPIPVRVKFEPKLFPSDSVKKTACGTLESEVPVESFDGTTLKVLDEGVSRSFPSELAKPATVELNSETYLTTGPHPPYGIDVRGHRLKFLFGFPPGQTISTNMNWWKEIVAKVPSLQKETGAFLIVESTKRGLRFTDSTDDYIRSDAREVRGTHEEFNLQPFSKVFFYPNENLRLLIPQSCR